MPLHYHRPLTVDEQIAAGLPAPAALALADHVHHDDLDALLHVNNVRYFVWFERLRIQFMEAYRIGTIGDPDSPRIVIRSGEIQYVEEMLRGEDYIVTCHCTAMRTTSLSLRQEIWSKGRLRASFDAVMVLLSQDGQSRVPVPDDIRAHLIRDGACQE